MHRIWGLYKKELRGYFNSPIAYIVITVLLIGIGYFFFQTFFVSDQASLRTFFRFAAWSFLLFGPAITMRQFAEEKKSGTIEGLLTLPIKEWEAVAGKFLAAWTLLAVYLVITFIYPITISFLGELDMGPISGGYFGLFLLGGTFISLGIFASTITRNQVISLITAFVIGLILFLLDLLLPFVPEALQSLVEFIGVDVHFKNVSRGVIDSRDLVYSISVMAFFLFLSVQALRTRMSDHSRKWRINRLLYLGSAFGCLIALNVFSFKAYGRLDLTADKMYTLSDASRSMVAELSDQLTINAYFSKNLPAPFNNHERFLRDLLEEYRTYSNGHLSFEFIDPGVPGPDGQPDPDLQAAVTAAKIPKIEVSKLEKDQVQMVKVFMGLSLRYGENSDTIPVLQNIDNLEYEISSRIAKLVRTKTPKVAFLTGHGELSSQQGATGAAGALGNKFNIADVDFSRGENPLQDVDVLVIAGPKQEIPAEQRQTIDQFVMNGGKVAFFLDRSVLDMQTMIGRPLTSGLEDLVANYGAQLGSTMLLDANSQSIGLTRAEGNVRFRSFVQFPPFLRVQDLEKDSPLVRNLRELTIPFAAPINLLSKPGIEAKVIAHSSPKTWLFEINDSFLVDPQALPQPAEGDYVGKQNLIVTLSGSFPSLYQTAAADKPSDFEEQAPALPAGVQSPSTRMVVIGSSIWLADMLQNKINAVFFANLMDWLAQDESLINIRTRGITERPLTKVSETARNLFKYGNMFIPPLALVAFGVVRWRMRAARKARGVTLSISSGK